MENFLNTETLIIELLLIVSLVALVARRLRIPYTRYSRDKCKNRILPESLIFPPRFSTMKKYIQCLTVAGFDSNPQHNRRIF